MATPKKRPGIIPPINKWPKEAPEIIE